MKRFPFFALLLCLSCIAVGQDDLRVAFRDGLYGYIDRSGTFVIQPRFIEASGWEDGAARVTLPDGEFAFIDSNGKYLMRPRQLDRVGYLSEGLALFEPKGAKYDTDGFVKNVGFIDVTGRVVIVPHLFAAYDFSEGVAAASVEFNTCGYIDKQGNFVIKPAFEFPSYQACGPFSEGLAHAMKGGKFGYIDHTGSFVIRPLYDYAYDFSEGYAVVGIGSRYVFIDKRGTVLGTSSYGFARAFSEGLAPVVPNDKWGFIDKSGALAIPTKYEEVGDFSEGLAWVRVNWKCGFINMHGDLVVPPKYDSASDFWNGIAEVVQNPTAEGDPEVRTIIDTAGSPVSLGKR